MNTPNSETFTDVTVDLDIDTIKDLIKRYADEQLSPPSASIVHDILKIPQSSIDDVYVELGHAIVNEMLQKALQYHLTKMSWDKLVDGEKPFPELADLELYPEETDNNVNEESKT